MRALRKEIIRISSAFRNGGAIRLCFNDSRVVVGACAKGRSSSFKLNGLLRTQLPFLVFGDLALALLWVETESNVADFPSRFRPLPAPKLPPEWLQRLGVHPEVDFRGIEIFAGPARLTQAHREFGFKMEDPVCHSTSPDLWNDKLDHLITGRLVRWVWLAPPVHSFSTQRAAQRPPGLSEGDAYVTEIAAGNLMWRRVLHLAAQVMDADGFFFIMHPRPQALQGLAVERHRVVLTKRGACSFAVRHAHILGRGPHQKPGSQINDAVIQCSLGALFEARQLEIQSRLSHYVSCEPCGSRGVSVGFLQGRG